MLAGVCVFHDNNRAIHKHPHGEDQPEHDDVRDGNPHERQKGKTQQKRRGNRKAHQKCRADAKGGQHHDHHQRNRGKDRPQKLLHHTVDDPALVVGGAKRDGGFQPLGPGGALGGDDLFYLRGGVDQIIAFAFDHLQRQCLFAVKSRCALAVFECQVDRRQIAQCHHTVAVGFNRQGIDIARVVERRRDLDGKAALIRSHFARSNQLVIILHHIDQLARGDVIGLQPQGVDQHLEHLVTVARQPRLKHGIHAFQRILKIARDAGHGAFGHGAGQVDDDDGEFGEVDLCDRIFLVAFGKFCFCRAHRVAHVGHDLGLVPAEFEFQRHPGIVFGGCAGHGFQAVQIGKFCFHRFDQQGFAIRGRDARKLDRNEKGRDLDVGLALFGQGRIGIAAHHKAQ